MTRRFATISEIVADNEPNRREQQDRDAFKDRQVTGRIVMVDRRCPYDPAEAIVMLLIATAAGGLVRAPLTSVENNALIEFAAAEGEPSGRGAAEMMRLRERVAELEREIIGRNIVGWGLRGRASRQIIAELLDCPVARRDRLAVKIYGSDDPLSRRRVNGIVSYLRERLAPAGVRIEGVKRIGWRLVVDAEARRRLADRIREGAA
jgi:hypothetical protein